MTQVINKNGKELDFEVAVSLMDDETRELLHNAKAWKDEQEFFTAYEDAHANKHGEEWELSKANPTY